MIADKTKIPAKIISLILAQVFLAAMLIYPESLPSSRYLYNSSYGLNIAHIPKSRISGGLRSPMGFGESGGLKRRAEFYIVMNTFRDRLYHSQDAIVALSESFPGKCVVYDVGPGWALGKLGPVTTVDLAKALLGRADVYGIEKQEPSYALYVGGITVVLFNQNDEIIFVNSADSEPITGDILKELDPARYAVYMSLANQLKREALAKGQKTASTEDMDLTYAIVFDPIRNYESESLRFINADLFNLRDIRNTIPNANIVRIANLLMVHYDAAYIEQALKSLADVTDNEAYVLIGLSDSDRFMFGYHEEEYLVYRKKDGAFALTDFMFSVDSDKLDFGVSSSLKIKPPLRELRSSFINLIKDSERADSIFNKMRRPDDYAPKDRSRLDFFRELETEIAQVLADGLIKRGIKASGLGNMVAINLDSLRNATDELGIRIKKSFWASYIDNGVPVNVDLNQAWSNLRRASDISAIRLVSDEI